MLVDCLPLSRATPETRRDAATWIAAGAVALLAVAAALRRVWAVDYWWQLATGRWVAEHGWPAGDPFSFTAAGGPWIELRWLFCWVQYRAVEAFGPPGAVTLKIALVLAAFLFVALPVARRRNAVVVATIVSVAVLASTHRFMARPEWVSHAAFAFFVWVVDRARRDGEDRLPRALWALPALQVVWVNSHPLFVFGPLVCGLGALAAGWEAWRRRNAPDGRARTRTRARRAGAIAAVGAACAAAALLNPWGLDGALHPLLLFSEVRDSVFVGAISELRGPFEVGAPWSALFWYKGLLVLGVLAALGNLRRLDLFWSLLAAAMFYLSALSVRSVPLFALAAIPWIADNVDRLRWTSPRDGRSWHPGLRTAGALALLVFVLFRVHGFATDRFYVRQGDSNQFGWGLAEDRFPAEGVEALRAAGAGPRVLAGLGESAYLLAHGFRVFADPRLEVYGEERFRRFLAVQTDPAALDAALAEYDLRAALVHPGSPAVGLLEARADWALVHLDPTAAVWLRQDAAAAAGAVALRGAARRERLDALLAELSAARAWVAAGPLQRVAAPHPALALADFCFRLGDAACAARFLDEAERRSPFVRGLDEKRAALATLLESAGRGDALDAARERLAAGDAAGAEREAEQAVADEPGNARAWVLLGAARAARGALPAAADAYSAAIRLEPDRVEHRVALAVLVGRMGYRAQAIEGLERALAVRPGDVAILRELARLELEEGDREAARERLRQALAAAPDDPGLAELRRRVEEP